MDELNELELDAFKLNKHIEKVENWIIVLEGKEFLPLHDNKASYYGAKYENLIFAARVEMFGFGRIYKRVILTSDKYDLIEIPQERWQQVWTQIYKPPKQDAMTPFEPVVVDNQIITVARWWPPNDYVKQLMEKRNFMTAPEFEAWANTIDGMHDKVGAKTPSYIKKRPYIQVPMGHA